MKIGLDIMGGDYAPAEAIKGVRLFLEQSHDSNVHLVLIGNKDAAKPFMSELEPFQGRFTLVDAPEIIGMHEHPTKALKEKPNSSISMGFGMLLKGKVDVFMSAGNTGAMLVGSMYSVKAIEGVLRPTIASPIPRLDGKFNLLLDVGINADCKPEHLVQFAQLGSLYSKHVLGMENPRVALLNIGEEEGKGNLLAQSTYPLLKECQGINFVGNAEGRDVFTNKAEVIVCEGFAGNVMLKMAESLYDILAIQKGFKDPFLEDFNFEKYGGTPILGINAPVIIGHGISHALAFQNMIKVAEKIVSSNLTDLIKEQFKQQVDTPTEAANN
ncbi:phosphate acyltransferase PlsX [Flavipsychrobacter stenotrophus]|uniref:Phosphate acyltransferase n=1 Tax=Flavipsychrobacter stenotrophus TaxID=2077091 RepID=A0A2S7T278_9BACT|nr:phosphate acyltransferase PlsX [Flavipsychrobacter stenotrophus]PQJ13064.1 phosphate acyltransferase PlsX [Flavipsychrobacter stenotrophus]